MISGRAKERPCEGGNWVAWRAWKDLTVLHVHVPLLQPRTCCRATERCEATGSIILRFSSVQSTSRPSTRPAGQGNKGENESHDEMRTLEGCRNAPVNGATDIPAT